MYLYVPTHRVPIYIIRNINLPTAAAAAVVAAGYSTNIPPTNDIYFMCMCVVSTNLYLSYSL